MVRDAGRIERLIATTANATRRLAAAFEPAAFGCLVLIGGCDAAATVDVAGQVVTADTGSPIVGATVANDSGETATTDDRGHFLIPMQVGDQRRLFASYDGRRDASLTTAVRMGETPQIILRLYRSNETESELVDAGGRVPQFVSDRLIHEQWLSSSMSDTPPLRAQIEPSFTERCAACHTHFGFVRQLAPTATEDTGLGVGAIGCDTCHRDETSAPASRSLRIFDRAAPIAGLATDHMGSGALCTSCHRMGDDAPHAPPHAPQGDVLLGRGSRLIEPMATGAHRYITDTCARCHMAADGHAFSSAVFDHRSNDDEGASACASCHGQEPVERFTLRDWDGDGERGAIMDEFDRALLEASRSIDARISHAAVTDRCTDATTASGYRWHNAALVLIGDDGGQLGDCDRNGVFDHSEAQVTTAALPDAVADAVHDLALVSRDGSRGVHNPQYVFDILRALR